MRKLLFCCFLLIVLVSANTSQASYDYSTGRWLQRDPLGVGPVGGKVNPFYALGQYKNGTNLFEYAYNRPTNYLDPFGLMSVACCKKELQKALSDYYVAAHYKFAKSLGDFWGPCIRKIQCENCGPAAMGAYNPFWREIKLCAKGLDDWGDVRDTLIHELVHAIQHCGYGVGCKQCIMDEVQAYYIDGTCDTPEDCLNAAWDSCSSRCWGKKKNDFLGDVKKQWPPEYIIDPEPPHHWPK